MKTRTRNASALALALALGSLSLLATLTGCSTPTAEAKPATSDAPAAAAGGPYTDGDYSATGDYQSPGGPEKIDVKVTLKGDIVTAVTVTPTATSGQAQRYQGEFADGVAAVVVGKKIDELKVDKVAGSSLTSDGFNAAIETIKADAAG